MYYVYILKLKNKEYYSGFTTDLKERLEKHSQKSVQTTRNKPIEKLIFYAAFNNKIKALDFEKYLKSSSGFAFRNKHLV